MAEWLGFRHVKRVNDTPVNDGGLLLNQLMNDASLSWRERWWRVRDLSAVFNLGYISRDFNVPTFALAALRTVRHVRFSFSTPRSDRVEGITLTLIEFNERTRPTLVAGSGGRGVLLRGKVWVDAADGRVRRTVERWCSVPMHRSERGCRSRCASSTTARTGNRRSAGPRTRTTVDSEPAAGWWDRSGSGNAALSRMLTWTTSRITRDERARVRPVG